MVQQHADTEREPIDLGRLDDMDDGELDKLAASLGLTLGDDTEDISVTDKPADADGQAAGLDGRSPEGTPDPNATAATKAPTGAELLKLFQDSPEAQSLVQKQLNDWMAKASAEADAKKEQEEFQKLIENGDYEEIGKRYVTAESEKLIQTKAEQQAMVRAYGEVYTGLFKELETLQLTDDDKKAIEPDKYATDAEYVLALSNLIAQRRTGSSIDDTVNKRVEEKLEALKNAKAAQAATGGSPSAVPGATGLASNGKETSRSLISEGFTEALEEMSASRVMS